MREKNIKETMDRVTRELISRCIKYSNRYHREIHISKSSEGRGINVKALDPRTPEGEAALKAFLKVTKHHYTISGLGSPSEPNSVNWRIVNQGYLRRTTNTVVVFLAMLLKSSRFKIRLYRLIGVHVGQDVEIMMGTWLDHFRPELIFIGNRSLIGAFSKITVHAYEGQGKFRYGVVSIGSDCKIAAGAAMGMIEIGDRVRTLPNTVLSPYFVKIPDGSIVGYHKPNCVAGTRDSDAAGTGGSNAGGSEPG